MSDYISYNTLIVLLGTSLLGANAGLVGTFALLRRRALLGDALAHATLPGLCLAVLLVGGRHLPMMLGGALVTGLIGVTTVAALRRWTRIKEDAALGIVLSVFFGAGIALSQIIRRHLEGGSAAGLESYIFGKTAGMIRADLYLFAAVAAASLAVIWLLYKEFKVSSFDPGFAQVQGWPTLGLDLLLMALIAVGVVIALPAVGVVLMAALLILPTAAARFWTDRLAHLLIIAAAFGCAIGATGTAISSRYSELPAGPTIVLVGTAVFVVSILFAPRRGGIARVVRHYRFRDRLQDERLLAAVYDLAEQTPDFSTPIGAEALWSRRAWTPARTHQLLDRAARRGLLEPRDGKWVLTEPGVAEAARAARADRLWRLFLTEHPELASGVADLDAETFDEALGPELVEELERKLAADNRLPRVPPPAETAPGTGEARS